MINRFFAVVMGCVLACGAFSVMAADESSILGSVSTTFNMIGPNDKIEVAVFDDPAVKGVACYLSYPKRGGIEGAIGIATERSDVSSACRQTGPISFDSNLKDKQEVFSSKRSWFFKELHVIRFIDRERKMLVYLTYSDHLIDGSPKNSITAVSYNTTP